MQPNNNFAKVNITPQQLLDTLKGADYEFYTKTRRYIITQLTAQGVSATAAAKWWSDVLIALKKHHGYNRPYSTTSTAQYQREQRIVYKKRMKQILRQNK